MLSENVVVGPIMEKNANYIPELVQIACKFDSRIEILFDNKRVNVKSIMGIMALYFSGGESITIQADGADEVDAVKAINEFLV